MTRSVCSLKSYAFWLTFVFILTFLFPTFVKAAAEDADKAASLRNLSTQLMDVGAEQLKRGAYSAAQKSLEQANENRQYLSASDQKKLDDLLAKSQGASVEREKVYDKMREADTLAKNKNYTQAIATLSSVQDSPYLTKSEKTQVQTNIKTYKDGLKARQQEMVSLFANSIKQYNDGKLEEARKGFEEVAASNVPLVSSGPTAKEYIAKIDEQMKQPAVVAKAAVPSETKGAAVEEMLTEQPKTAAAPAPVENVANNNTQPKTQPQAPIQPPQPSQPVAEKPSAVEPVVVKAQPERVPSITVTSVGKPSTQNVAVEGGYIDKVMQQRNVQRSYTEAVVDDAAAKANVQIAEGKFELARDSVNSARLVVDNNKMLLGDELYKQMSERLNVISREIDAKSAAAVATGRQEKEQKAIELQQQLRGQQEAERCQRIIDLMNKAVALEREQRYDDARGQLELLLAIDPLNQQALIMHQTLTDMINYRKQLEVRAEIDDQTNKTFLNADKSNIPHADEVTYPRDWKEITSKRTPEEAAGMSPADAQLNKQLDTPVDLSKLTPDTAFGDAITMLQNSVQPAVKIFVKWGDLQDNADITRLTRVNMEPVSGIPLRKALELLLSSVSGGGAVQLGYVIEDGVITIATKPSLPSTLVQRSYVIGDLLGVPANFYTDMSNMGLGQSQQAATAGGQGGGGGRGGQQQQQQQQQQQMSATEMAAQAQTRIQDIETMIQEIEPDSWYVNGGKGTVRVYAKSLIIVQTAEVHQKITKLIDDLRQAAGLGQQISIEARFLLVSESFLEDIGFDVDFTAIKLGGQWDPLQISQDSITTTSGTENVAMQVKGAYGGVLDDLQVQFLVKATQQSNNARSLLAPRVTVINGESAFISNITWQSYVSNISVDQSAASSGNNTSTVFATLQTDISQVSSGVGLNITPIMSADRKYVTLLIRTQTTSVLSLSPYVFFPIAGSTVPSTIFVPETQTTIVNTRVSVPDKGTLLLGGQKITDESNVEAGVPILGKIPILGRLFNNRSETRSQKVLLILVTPTILLQEEKEAEAVANMKPAGL